MSFAELLAEIPRLTPEQRAVVVETAEGLNVQEKATKGPRLWLCKETGLLVGAPGDVIRQAEIDAILADFP